MSGKCNICSKATSGKKAKIQCKDCQLLFHGSCVNLPDNDINFYQQEGEVWRCDPCAKSRRKSMRVESELSKSEPDVSDVVKLLQEMREENKLNITHLELEIGKSVEFNHEKIEELSAIIKIQSESLKNFEIMYKTINEENVKLKRTVSSLEQRIDDLEQYSRGNCLEINGIPEEKNENILDIVTKLGTSLGMTINEDMVDTCHRLGQKTPDKVRGVIVKFTRRIVKEEMLRKRRIKRNLNTKDIGFTNQSAEVIYMNESLTPIRRKIFNAARALKKEKGYQFLWVRNGKVLMRMNEGAKVISITSLEQIATLRDSSD